MAAMVDQPDPAAVFACAKSLHDACIEREKSETSLDLSVTFRGMDQFMREVMRVAELFEKWACRHVAFEEIDEVWPYLLEERFGAACIERVNPDILTDFDLDACFAIASEMNLPLWIDKGLSLAFRLEASNPVLGSDFSSYRIQTFRTELESGESLPFVAGNEESDENFSLPFFAIHGLCREGTEEFIARRETYQEAAALLRRMFPGIDLPRKPIGDRLL